MSYPPPEWLARHAELHAQHNRATRRLATGVFVLTVAVFVLATCTGLEAGRLLGWW